MIDNKVWGASGGKWQFSGLSVVLVSGFNSRYHQVKTAGPLSKAHNQLCYHIGVMIRSSQTLAISVVISVNLLGIS